MDTSIENSAMSLGALTQQYYAIAQNLANANTAGYKRQIVTFYEMMANQVSQDEGAGGNSGAVDDYIWVDYTQGTLLSSQRKLDCAIEGKGFLTVETPEGLRYTRNGTLRFNDVGKLVDGMGNSVIGQRGPIMLPPGVSPEQILIEQDGTISSPDGQPLGKLAMVEFTNMSALSPVGDCYIMAGEDAGKQNATQSKLHQGYLESSNSNMTDELVKMLMVTKLYEANIKSINLQDEKMRQLLNAAM